MIKMRIEGAADGHVVPILQVNEGDIHLGSMVDGRYAASVWCQKNIHDEMEVLVLVGMGDLQIVREASGRLRERIVVYEPDVGIYETMRKTCSFDELCRNPHVVMTDSLDVLYRELALICNNEALSHAVFCVHPGYISEEWNTVIGEIRHTLEGFIDSLTRTRSTIYGHLDNIIRNELMNLVYMKDGILLSRLRDRWPVDLPFILVGAGPSLNKNIQELKKVGNRACILCMDTAFLPLVKAGIRPHMLATMDAYKKMEVFGDVSKLDIPLLVMSNSRHEVVRDSKSSCIWCYEAHEFTRQIRKAIEKKPPVFPIQSGVSSMAVSVPLELKSRKIILIGQDLAFSYSGESHAGVIRDGLNEKKTCMLDGYYGGKVQSREDWAVMKEQWEGTIRANSDREFVNATEGGVRIEGTRTRSLADVVEHLPERNDNWNDILMDPAVHITEQEYSLLIKQLMEEMDQLNRIRDEGHDAVFYDANYRRPAIFETLLVVMRSRSEATRKERFDKAIEVLEGYLQETREEIEVWKN